MPAKTGLNGRRHGRRKKGKKKRIAMKNARKQS